MIAPQAELLVLPCHVHQVIRNLLDLTSFVIVVEHDLAVLDYLSDFICCLYGKPGAYGVVTLPFGVRWATGMEVEQVGGCLTGMVKSIFNVAWTFPSTMTSL